MNHLRHRVLAFSLVEVVIAVGIVTFGLVGIYSLLPAGLSSVEESSKEGRAVELLAKAEIDLRNCVPGSSSSTLGINPYAPSAVTNVFLLGKNGTVVTTTNNADFKLTAINRPSGNPQIAAWNLQVAWPPQAANPSDSIETLVFLNRLSQ